MDSIEIIPQQERIMSVTASQGFYFFTFIEIKYLSKFKKICIKDL